MSLVVALRAHVGSRGLRALFELVFVTGSLATVLPLFVADYLPIQDLPQHAAAVRVLWDYQEDALGFARFFERTPGSTQYLSVYLAAGLLSSVFGAVHAIKIVLAASLVALPYALRSLLTALHKPQSYALLALPLAYNAHLVLGFFNFLAALPLMLWSMALAVRLARTWSRSRCVILALVLLSCFYTHVVPYALSALTAVLVVALSGIGARRALSSLSALIPSGLAALLWLVFHPAGKALGSLATGAPAQEPRYLSLSEALSELPMWYIDVFHVGSNPRVFVLWLLAVLAVYVVGFATRRPSFRADRLLSVARGTVALVVLLCAVGYFAMPASYGFMWPINARFAWIALLLALAATPRVKLPARVLLGVAAVAFTASTTAAAFRAFRGAGQLEYAGLSQLVSRVPQGSRVAGLIFDRSSAFVKFSPYLHAVAWFQAERGGAVQFTFADFPHSPFRFRSDNRPPRVPPRWEWLPHRVNPATDLDWFDFVLTRGPAQSLRGFTRVAQAGSWSLWQDD